MKNYFRQLIGISIPAVVLLIINIISPFYVIRDKEIIYFLVMGIVTGIGVSAFLYVVLKRNTNKKDVIMYNIAIIGLPKSGKTTFITSMFGAVMYGKINLNGYNAIVKGNSTIDRINENLSLLDKGIPVGSTTDQTLFSYRVNIEEKTSPVFRLRKEYQIEIGDFQGEMTQDLIDLKTNIWKHDSEFFNWVNNADAFVFIVDLGYYFIDKNAYIAEISKSLRSAWQKIVELNNNQITTISKKPVVLIFNKADVLLDVSNSASDQRINFLAFSKNELPEVKYLDIEESMTKEILDDFDKLINFFKMNCKNFNFNFYSSFLGDKYEYRRGLSDICNHIFPVYVNRNKNQS